MLRVHIGAASVTDFVSFSQFSFDYKDSLLFLYSSLTEMSANFHNYFA